MPHFGKTLLIAVGLLLGVGLPARDPLQAQNREKQDQLKQSPVKQSPAKQSSVKQGQQKQDQEKSSPDALAMYADAANFQNNDAFELAVEEWTKFLQKYPKDPLATTARHYLGVCRMQLKQYDAAAKDFALVVAADPKFEMLEEAYLNLGWCHYKLAASGRTDEYSKALAAFNQLFKQFKQGKHVDQALYFAGESLYGQGKKAEAVAYYVRLIKQFPESSLRCQTLYALGVAQEELQKWSEASTTYDLFLKGCPDSELFDEVRLRKAEIVLQAGDPAKAEKMFAEIAAARDFASADHALFRQAFCAAKQDKYEAAGALYAKLPEAFPESAYIPEALIAAGRNYYRAGKLEIAAIWLQKSAEAGGMHAPEAAHWLCRVLLQHKQPQKVIDLVNQVLPKAADSSFLVNLKLDQADALYELAEWREDSIDRYLDIVRQHAQHELAPQALYNAAFAAMELKRYDDAIKYASSFASAFGQDRLLADAQYVGAESLLLSGEHERASQAFRKLRTDFSQHQDRDRWGLRLALSLYLQRKFSDVSELLNKSIPNLKSPDLIAEANFLLGASQFETDQIPEAIESLNAALQANPEWKQADETWLLLARAHQRMDQFVAAKSDITKMMQQFPQSRLLDQAHYRLAEVQFASGDLQGALALYHKVLSTWNDSPFVPYALYGKGRSQIRLKDLAGATKSFTQLIDQFGSHPLAADAYLARASARREAGQFEDTVKDIEAFLATKPAPDRRADALYEQGLAQVGLQNYDAAVRTFTALLDNPIAYPHVDQVLYELAWAYKSQEDAPHALSYFQRLTNEFPDSPLAAEAYFHLAEGEYEAKEYDKAIPIYAQAKKAAANGEIAEKSTYKSAWSRYQLKQYEPAAAEFQELIRKFPGGSLRADSLFMGAECLFKQEKYEQALAAFQEAATATPTVSQMEVLTLLHAGQCAAQLKRWKESIDFLRQVQTKFADSPFVAEAYYESGWAKQNLEQIDEAMKDYEQAANSSRDHVGARARFMMGEILFEKKQYTEAIKQFQRVMFGFGGDNSSPDVKVWQAKAGHEAGRCAEVQVQTTNDPKRKLELVADAKRYYEYVAGKHPQDNLAAEAKRRLQTLGKF